MKNKHQRTLTAVEELLKKGEKSLAQQKLIPILQSDPSLAQAWYLLSLTLDSRVEIEFALERVLEINPDHQKAKAKLKYFASLEGEDQIPAYHQEQDRRVLRQASASVKAGNVGTARSLIRYILRHNPNSSEAWYLLSFCVPEKPKKISSLNQALTHNPEHQQARERLESLQREDPAPESDFEKEEARSPSTFSRLFKFTSFRLLTLAAAVVVGVFLTIIVATKGTVIESELTGNLLKGWMGGVWAPVKIRVPRGVNPDYTHMFSGAEGAVRRAFVVLFKGLTLQLGDTGFIMFYTGEQQLGSVYSIIMEFLPRTLLLFGATNLLLFLITIFISLRLSRSYGHWLDRVISALNPLSSIPSWVYGLLLTVFFARVLHFFPGGRLESWPTEFSLGSLLTLGRKLLIPVLAIFISKFFQSVYIWRTFFLIYSEEDYVEMAKAKGLTIPSVTRKYILKPTLPIIITRFSMILISIWQEAIIIELFFNVAGIGHLFYQSLLFSDIPLIVGLVVVFAYTIAISVFLLDFVYAVVDPRVRVGGKREVMAGRAGKGFLNPLKSTLQGTIHRVKSLFERRGSYSLKNFLKAFRNRLASTWELIEEGWRGVGTTLETVIGYPTAVAGLVVISLLVLVSVVTVVAIPYPQAVDLWRDEGVWVDNPQKAAPAWTNLFRTQKQPRTIIFDSKEGDGTKQVNQVSEGKKEIELSFSFDYPYQGFPEDIILYLEPEYQEKRPFATLYWKTPQGRVMELRSYSPSSSQKVKFSKDTRIARRVEGGDPQHALFSEYDPKVDTASSGTYQLHISGIAFEKNADLDAKLVILGRVHGLAGTDHKGRNLGLALLWGTPVALGFGLLAALANSLTTMLIAAVGTWWGGWVDAAIQRISDMNMIIPVFPVLLMVYNWYSNRLWVILAVYIALGIFGAGIKTYRSAFLQVRELPYIEAAQSYGASNTRMVFIYLVPRTISILIPQLINMVPAIVFLETTLAYLNMSDPLLPTWGKLIREAFAYGGLDGAYFWVLEPFGMMMLTAFGFLILGSSLERIFNPRLRNR